MMSKIISILKITPSSITVQVGKRTVKVSGESFVRGYGSPDFIIDVSNINNWDKPFNLMAVTEVERNFILDYLLKELAKRKLIVRVE